MAENDDENIDSAPFDPYNRKRNRDDNGSEEESTEPEAKRLRSSHDWLELPSRQFLQDSPLSDAHGNCCQQHEETMTSMEMIIPNITTMTTSQPFPTSTQGVELFSKFVDEFPFDDEVDGSCKTSPIRQTGSVVVGNQFDHARENSVEEVGVSLNEVSHNEKAKNNQNENDAPEAPLSLIEVHNGQQVGIFRYATKFISIFRDDSGQSLATTASQYCDRIITIEVIMAVGMIVRAFAFLSVALSAVAERLERAHPSALSKTSLGVAVPGNKGQLPGNTEIIACCAGAVVILAKAAYNWKTEWRTHDLYHALLLSFGLYCLFLQVCILDTKGSSWCQREFSSARINSAFMLMMFDCLADFLPTAKIRGLRDSPGRYELIGRLFNIMFAVVSALAPEHQMASREIVLVAIASVLAGHVATRTRKQDREIHLTSKLEDFREQSNARSSKDSLNEVNDVSGWTVHDIVYGVDPCKVVNSFLMPKSDPSGDEPSLLVPPLHIFPVFEDARAFPAPKPVANLHHQADRRLTSTSIPRNDKRELEKNGGNSSNGTSSVPTTPVADQFGDSGFVSDRRGSGPNSLQALAAIAVNAKNQEQISTVQSAFDHNTKESEDRGVHDTEGDMRSAETAIDSVFALWREEAAEFSRKPAFEENFVAPPLGLQEPPTIHVPHIRSIESVENYAVPSRLLGMDEYNPPPPPPPPRHFPFAPISPASPVPPRHHHQYHAFVPPQGHPMPPPPFNTHPHRKRPSNVQPPTVAKMPCIAPSSVQSNPSAANVPLDASSLAAKAKSDSPNEFVELERFDVVCGRSTKVTELHDGNVRFRDTISRYRNEYRSTRKRAAKQVVLERVMAEVRSWRPGGRFVVAGEREAALSSTKAFLVASADVAEEKVRKALRRDMEKIEMEKTRQRGRPPKLA